MNSVQHRAEPYTENKVSIIDSALHKIKAEFSSINNLPKSTENPLWDEIRNVCNLTLAEVVALMNVRCGLTTTTMNVSIAPISRKTITAPMPNTSAPARIVLKGTTFIHLHFDVVIQIAELLPLDTIISLYIATKKFQLLATNYHRQTKNIKEALIMVINKRMSLLERNDREDILKRVAHIITDAADIHHMPLNFIYNILYKKSSKSNPVDLYIVPSLLADHSSLFTTRGRIMKARENNRRFGYMRNKNLPMLDHLRNCWATRVSRHPEKYFHDFCLNGILNINSIYPNCFAYPVYTFTQLLKKINDFKKILPSVISINNFVKQIQKKYLASTIIKREELKPKLVLYEKIMASILEYARSTNINEFMRVVTTSCDHTLSTSILYWQPLPSY